MREVEILFFFAFKKKGKYKNIESFVHLALALKNAIFREEQILQTNEHRKK